MLRVRLQLLYRAGKAGAVLAVLCPTLWATTPESRPASATPMPPLQDILSAEQQARLETSVERALIWLASQQNEDGSFITHKTGRPAVTALCVLATMSKGHLPGDARYGPAINRGIDFVLNNQHPDGLLTMAYPTMPVGPNNPTHTASYNHAIAGLMLSEAYGMTAAPSSERIRKAVTAAIGYSIRRIPQPKRHKADEGAWRYPQQWQDSDSDLSITSWQLMFLRSCRNAGFEVPSQYVDEALGFVRRCYNPADDTFWYALRGRERVTTRAMVGAGILSLSLAGEHQSPPALDAGRWLLRHPFDSYRAKLSANDRFFYGAFYCSHAAFQLGGRYWSEFYPVLYRTLLQNQRPDGSWDPERGNELFGGTYSTAMAVLALTPPYQFLPIFQR